LAGRTCERKVRKWIAEEWDNPAVELVFEAGDIGKGKLQQRLAIDRGYSPVFKPKKDRVLPDGSTEYGFVPLQAADWLSYEMSLLASRVAYKDAQIDSVRWAMNEFFSLPGHSAMGVYTIENIEQFEQNLKLSKDLLLWERSLNLKRLAAS
jgi:hypothetical protein